MDRLSPLIRGVAAAGRPLYVPTEMKLEAATQALDLVLALGGREAEGVRALARAATPSAIAVLAELALGVDKDGRPSARADPAAQAEATAFLVRQGWATRAEI